VPTRSIPWPRILAEGVAIVVSILLAFGIQAWWEGRQERQDEGEILVGLRTEFEEIEQDLLRYTDWYRFTTHDIEALLSVEGRAPRAMTVAAADTALWSLLFVPSYDPGQATLDGLVASGRLERLQSRPLRDALNVWRNSLDEIRDDQVAFQEFVLSTLVPYLARAGVPLSRVLAASRTAAERGTETQFPPTLVPESALAVTYDQVRSTPEFRGLAAYRLSNARGSNREVTEGLEAVREILRLLNE